MPNDEIIEEEGVRVEELLSRREKMEEISHELESEIDDLEKTLNNPKSREEEGELQEKLRNKRTDLANIKSEIEQINRKLQDSYDEEVGKYKGQIQEIIEEGKSEVAEFEDYTQEMEERVESIKETNDEIETIAEDIEELEEAAKGLIEKTTGAALGEQFDARKKELEQTLRYWKYASVGSIVLLLIAALVIYADISGSGSNALNSISKLALLVPISVAVWFSVSNYSRQKKLMEEYEFKARMALSLSGFREVLRKELPGETHEEMAEFVRETMDKIYSNPQINIQDGEGADSSNDPLTNGQKPLVELIRRLGK